MIYFESGEESIPAVNVNDAKSLTQKMTLQVAKGISIKKTMEELLLCLIMEIKRTTNC